MRLALFQPDIPQNLGAAIRLGACFGVELDVIEPCGFLWDDRRLRRAGMDYLEGVEVQRHTSLPAFLAARVESPGRLVLLTTRAEAPHYAFRFQADDTLVLGSESAGAPEAMHRAAQARIRVPLTPGMRSLNVALAAGIVLGEALRQTNLYPST